jgi:tRNA threonylcarbamoyladenosine biosynthesis protein TsaB
MNILALDSSSNKIEFALFSDGREVLKHTLSENENADALVYNISLNCKDNNFNVRDIDVVALSNGPGSFTGIRIASAIAKAFCMAADAKLVEVNSLDVIANKIETDKIIVPLIFSNSRTNEFYYSRFKKENGHLTRISDYDTALLKDIINDDDFFVTNGKIQICKDKVMEYNTSNIISLYQLTLNYISQNLFSDYNTSEPFYMKEFVPLKSQKKLI